MSLPDVMRRAIEDHDVDTCRKVWAEVAPNMPQPKTDAEARAIMHHACTQIENIRFRARAYSHRWLTDNGFPSGLPDNLRPKAERMYPVIHDAVGIACGVSSSLLKPLVPIIQGAMANVVLEHYADNVKDPEIIKPRMLEARRKAIKQLIG